MIIFVIENVLEMGGKTLMLRIREVIADNWVSVLKR